MFELTGTAPYPIFKTNQQNGNAVMRFDGTKSPLVSNVALNIRHIFIVAKHHATSFDGVSRNLLSFINLDVLTDSGGLFYPLNLVFGDKTIIKVNGVKVPFNQIPVPYNQFKLYEIQIPTQQEVSGISVGGSVAVSERKWKGDIGDVFISDKKFLESDVWEIEEHLMKKWAIN